MKGLKIDVNNIIQKVSEINLTKKSIVEFLQKYESNLAAEQTIEFYDFKEYTPQDNPRTIDWKTSLRRGSLICRKTIIEKEPEVIIAIDIGETTLYSSIDKLKIEYELEIAIGLAYICLVMGFSVGVILYNDKRRVVIKDTAVFDFVMPLDFALWIDH